MANHVAIPSNVDEAALMVLTGVAWLKEHAPERLTGDEYKKDAERYRWLRHGDNDERGAIQRPGVLTYMLRDGLLDMCCDVGIAADAEEAANTVAVPAVGAA